jgi:hypothetical protein
VGKGPLTRNMGKRVSEPVGSLQAGYGEGRWERGDVR